MGVFLLLSSVMFYLQIMQARSSDLPTFVGQMSYLWMLLSPVLTMRDLLTPNYKIHKFLEHPFHNYLPYCKPKLLAS